jgi:predicted small integral membrane protein
VISSRWHRVVYAFVLAVEILVAVLLWRAVIALFAAASGGVETNRAIASANVALSGFLVLVFVMMFGGAWFVYYIRQEGAQITHFALLCVGLLATLLVNS